MSLYFWVFSFVQMECEVNAPDGITEPGEVVKTSAGDIRGCQAIYHTNCPPFKNRDCKQVMKDRDNSIIMI